MAFKFSLLALFMLVVYTSSACCLSVGGDLKHISAGVAYLWGVNKNDQISRCERPCKNWVKVGGSLMQIDVGDDEVWGVNKANQIFKMAADGTGGWRRISGGLKHVSASGNGYIWGVNKNDDIFKCRKPCLGKWIRVGGKLKQIDGGHKYVYGVNKNNDVFSMRVDGTAGGWRHIPGQKLKYVTASGTNDIFGVSTNNEIFRCPKPCVQGEFEKMPGKKVEQCEATIDGIFGVSSGYFHTVIGK